MKFDKFDELLKKVTEMVGGDAGIGGNDLGGEIPGGSDSYATGDNRIPNFLYSGKVSKKRKKKRKKKKKQTKTVNVQRRPIN